MSNTEKEVPAFSELEEIVKSENKKSVVITYSDIGLPIIEVQYYPDSE